MIYGKLPIVFLGILASEKSGSTNSIIASYILSHLEEMKEIGIKEFASSCNVSISSISRFCRDVGLESFAELKMILVQSNLDKGPESLEGDFLERLDNYHAQTVKGLQSVKDSLSEKQLDSLVTDLTIYDKVAVFGLMKAETAALILQSDLLMYGKQVYTNLSYKEQMDYLLEADEEQLVIIFSFTNSYFDYSSLKPFLRKKRHPKIWIITGSNVAAPSFVAHCLRFKSSQNHFEHPSQLSFVATIIAQEYNHRLHQRFL